MASDTIREFLVALGFKVDESGLRRFVKSTEGATKVVAGLAVAATTAAVAVVASVNKIASQFEDLYYASQRTRSSVANIQATQFAFTQLGGTAQQALSVMDGLASFMRNNPASEGFIHGLGVETRKANGDLRDTSDILHDLAGRFRAMPFYRAKITAGLMGIDEQSLLVLLRDRGDQEKKFRNMLAGTGVDPQALAKDAHDFRVKLRDLGAKYELLGIALASKMFPFINKFADQLDHAGTELFKWFSTPGAATLGDSIANLARALWTLQTDIWGIEKEVLHFLNLDSFDRLGQVINSLADVIDAVTDFLTGNIPGMSAHLQKVTSGAVTYALDTVQKHGATVDKNSNDALQGAFKATTALLSGDLAGFAVNAAQAINGAKGALNQSNKADISRQDAVAFFQKQGWTKEQAAGIVANLSWESGLQAHGKPGDNGTALGLAQWHADRRAAFEKQFGIPFAKSTTAQQLAFVNQELTTGSERRAGALLRATKDAFSAAAVVSQFYERPKAVEENKTLRGNLAVQILGALAQSKGRVPPTTRRPVPALRPSIVSPEHFDRMRVGGLPSQVHAPGANSKPSTSSVTIQQKTDIHVDGSNGTATSTAKEVLRGQHRVNGDLVRNFKSQVT